ncbi:Uma2 family endonuclease [Saccharopolyspora indica]|uniref:Uma2 family endonuclease n=1 Tax=Saccharopolyspora indica TaxID=1229659 RepID=UPI0022EA8656|nr:Uma2 family endonuclease [Saccharopolyspora indica]MDA3646593.1 Uma2 family endonuclease [Saccharopolyspora indica]
MTVADLESFSSEDERYELVGGRVEVSYPQEARHACATTRLAASLSANAPEGFEVLLAPVIILDDAGTHCRRPDLVVVDSATSSDPWLTCPPLLVVEVAGDETVSRDYHTKVLEYEKFGIPAYWLVNPGLVVDELRLKSGKYQHVRQALRENLFATDFPFPVAVVPNRLFEDGPMA